MKNNYLGQVGFCLQQLASDNISVHVGAWLAYVFVIPQTNRWFILFSVTKAVRFWILIRKISQCGYISEHIVMFSCKQTQYTHVKVWRRNTSVKIYVKCIAFPLKTQNLHRLWLAGNPQRVKTWVTVQTCIPSYVLILFSMGIYNKGMMAAVFTVNSRSKLPWK